MNPTQAALTLTLVSHTNVGKTTLARTLLGRDIGEVRDAPHVTEFAERHTVLETASGKALMLWDTPGFGDSARLVRRLRQRQQPLGWLLGEVWDRWRDRPFWAAQQALRHVQADSDVLLYLVNASERPQAAPYLAAEMALLDWVGKPVLVLLNQLGPPQPPEQEAAERETWRDALADWPAVRGVLPLDAFARCWVHEAVLLQAVEDALTGERAALMAELRLAWEARQAQRLQAAMAVLAEELAALAADRQAVQASPWGEWLGRVGDALRPSGDERSAAAAAERALAQRLEDAVRRSTGQLLALHALQGTTQGEILARVAQQFQRQDKLPEGRAALIGGALTGALAGLKADLASGGLTLGGGLIAGSLLGALGAASLAHGLNRVRGTDRNWLSWSDAALQAATESALLRYLAVAHFGRGRGDWVQGEAPAHWVDRVQAALAHQHEALLPLWRGLRAPAADTPQDPDPRIALAAILSTATKEVLAQLYPGDLGTQGRGGGSGTPGKSRSGVTELG